MPAVKCNALLARRLRWGTFALDSMKVCLLPECFNLAEDLIELTMPGAHELLKLLLGLGYLLAHFLKALIEGFPLLVEVAHQRKQSGCGFLQDKVVYGCANDRKNRIEGPWRAQDYLVHDGVGEQGGIVDVDEAVDLLIRNENKNQVNRVFLRVDVAFADKLLDSFPDVA
ncbi:MAG: hypothetical protein KatS3mg114_0150 [Planctomycetaceae bacterium]|nr:MAG: hypothetical protein KatS3mg114_0150 [Planctomycetaceae bacterium]